MDRRLRGEQQFRGLEPVGGNRRLNEGRVAGQIAGTDVRPALDQQCNRLRLARARYGVQGISAPIDLGPAVNQGPGDRQIAVNYCFPQWPDIIFDICACRDHRPHPTNIVGLNGFHELAGLGGRRSLRRGSDGGKRYSEDG